MIALEVLGKEEQARRSNQSGFFLCSAPKKARRKESTMVHRLSFLTCGIVCLGVLTGHALELDESPAAPGEWGYRPGSGDILAVNPPSFAWRPEKGMVWEIQCAAAGQFNAPVYQAKNVPLNVHCPDKPFLPGTYTWRYRGQTPQGQTTRWSQIRQFQISPGCRSMPMPPRAELISRIPSRHPRLFLRPENVPHLRTLAGGDMQSDYQRLIKSCERIMKQPPDTSEPPLYPQSMARGSDAWRKMWWGNRTYTSTALNQAAILAFTRLLGGPEAYGRKAKEILIACAQWDPKGSTGYRYNDEAGMPYNYYFARTYTFVNDLLSGEEKQICRDIMRIRGQEMYAHLCPNHLWKPYSSHSNRAWHFLGEVGIAFLGEIPEAEDWVWFAMNVFYNVYPVWSDDDGGWHEGISYWGSYQNRFTWWADVMREAMGINAFDKPYYAQAGYYAMYLTPPGKVGAGLGDLNASKTASHSQSIMRTFAAQAQNPYWQWYVDQVGGSRSEGHYIGFMRGALAKVTATSPRDLPASRLFQGIGQAYLNTQILDAQDSVQVVFKSSPFGTQSHGYEANNSFLLWAYGERLLIRSGYRDQYGSAHHKNWMWSTRSVNNITVNGQGQVRRSSLARGRITGFETTPEMDVVVGEAGSAYETPLDRFTRSLVFVKPDLMIACDQLRSTQAASFEYWLHAVHEMEIPDQHHIAVKSGRVLCDINFLHPSALALSQTDQYDPNPRERITLREWHVQAATRGLKKDMEFITLYRVHRDSQSVPKMATLDEVAGGYILTAKSLRGEVTLLLPRDSGSKLRAGPLQTQGQLLVSFRPNSGKARVIKMSGSLHESH
ncbi:MAG: DUF4962 domain-containing protein [Planctomycetes bacterium]|nr:DUF4962 domain-containing protein [Planctomycetota bacterium]